MFVNIHKLYNSILVVFSVLPAVLILFDLNLSPVKIMCHAFLYHIFSPPYQGQLGCHHVWNPEPNLFGVAFCWFSFYFETISTTEKLQILFGKLPYVLIHITQFYRYIQTHIYTYTHRHTHAYTPILIIIKKLFICFF